MIFNSIKNKIKYYFLVTIILRLLYVFILSQFSRDNEFNNYILFISLLAVLQALSQPLDMVVSRFSNSFERKNVGVKYLLSHLLIRLAISFPAISFIYIFKPNALPLGVSIVLVISALTSVMSSLIYSHRMSLDKHDSGAMAPLLSGLALKLFPLFGINIFGFYKTIFISELIFIFSSFFFITVYMSKFLKKRNISCDSTYRSTFIEILGQLKIYGSYSIIGLPISYIKSNGAALFAASQVSANQLVIILFIQKGFDVLKTTLSAEAVTLSAHFSGEKYYSKIISIKIILFFSCLYSILTYWFSDATGFLIVVFFGLTKFFEFSAFLFCFKKLEALLSREIILNSAWLINATDYLMMIFIVIFVRDIKSFAIVIGYRAVLGLIVWRMIELSWAKEN
jgi:hypothetical protein